MRLFISPSNRTVFIQEFLKYNSPIVMDNFLILSIGTDSYDLNLIQGTYKIKKKIPDSFDNSIKIKMNPSVKPENGNQYLKVNCILYNDKHEVVGEFEDELSNKYPDSWIKFSDVKIEDWFSIEISAVHQLNKYSPSLETIEKQNDNSWSNEIVLSSESKHKLKFDIVTPIQQSVYIVDDSLRTSLYNFGLNAIWYKRKTDYEQTQFQSIAYGLGLYISEIDKLVESQNLMVGLTGLLNFNINNVGQIAIGGGPTWSHYFKDVGDKKKGDYGYFTFVLQFRLPMK